MANSEDKNKLTYPVQIGDQKITLPDNSFFKQKGLKDLENYYTAALLEVKEKYDELLDDYNINKRIYSSHFKFEPVIGNVYHLYINFNDEEFLSLIAPNEWEMTYLGSFKLNSENLWEKVILK